MELNTELFKISLKFLSSGIPLGFGKLSKHCNRLHYERHNATTVESQIIITTIKCRSNQTHISKCREMNFLCLLGTTQEWKHLSLRCRPVRLRIKPGLFVATSLLISISRKTGRVNQLTSGSLYRRISYFHPLWRSDPRSLRGGA